MSWSSLTRASEELWCALWQAPHLLTQGVSPGHAEVVTACACCEGGGCSADLIHLCKVTMSTSQSPGPWTAAEPLTENTGPRWLQTRGSYWVFVWSCGCWMWPFHEWANERHAYCTRRRECFISNQEDRRISNPLLWCGHIHRGNSISNPLLSAHSVRLHRAMHGSGSAHMHMEN